MENNRTTKYLLYAIGEIILVVIGILIALQINNWNENQKLKSYEKDILIEIKSNLTHSREEVLQAIKDDIRWRECIKKILDHLDNDKPYDSNLDQCFGSYYWSSTVQFATSAYDELKGKGIEIISNPKLRRDITATYDFKLDVIKSEVEVWDSQLLSSTIYPLHTQLFKKYYPQDWKVFEDEYAKPVDYEVLKTHTQFKNLLTEIMSLRNYSITINNALENDLQNLIQDIDKELRILKND